MNREEFYSTLQNENAPKGVSPFLLALWYDKRGDWEKSHDTISEIEDNNAYLIHAYLHRKEGDISNARYWYGRAGGKFPDGLTLDEEWERLVGGMVE